MNDSRSAALTEYHPRGPNFSATRAPLRMAWRTAPGLLPAISAAFATETRDSFIPSA